MALLVLRVLGGFAISVDGVVLPTPSTKRARALLVYLAMNRKADLARERLIEQFWPDADGMRGRDNLKAALWSIRRSLRLGGLDPDLYVVADRSVVRWLSEIEIDAERFLTLLAMESADADADAIALYRGNFLEGDYDDWALSQRDRFTRAYEVALARSVRRSNDLGSASRLLELDPYEESAYVTLIEGELKHSRLQGAVTYAERCRAALAEVGSKPSRDFETRFGSLHHKKQIFGEAALPFSGREAELSLLEELCDNAQRQRASLLLIHGDAGIGKSTLVERTLELCAGRGLKVRTIRAIAEDSRPLGPWQDVFTAGMPLDSVASTVQGPIPEVLVVEDAHALTSDAFALTLEVVRKSKERLIILTSRPEGVEALRNGFKGLEYSETALQPLKREELGASLISATGSEATELLDALWDRSGGHPYFASSLFSALVHRGVLIRHGSSWRIEKPLPSPIELPASLKRFIQLRLKSRGPNAPLVAAALGLDPAATADDLVAVIAIGEALMFDALDDLLALGLIVESSGGSSFAFVHDLISEVAVGMVNPGRRASMHRAFAVRLDAQQGHDITLRRARHLRAAGQTLESAELYIRAAAEAVAWNALRTARELVEESRLTVEGLEQTPARDSTLSKLHAFAARLRLADGDPKSALGLASDAVAFARAGGNEIELARAFLTQAFIRGTAFEPDAQRRCADAALEVAERRGARDLQAAALVQRAEALRLTAQGNASLEASRAAYTAARSCNDWFNANRATEERLRTELTWWRFSDAWITVNRAFEESSPTEILGHASLLQTRAAFWFLMGRYHLARRDLQDAQQLLADSNKRQSLVENSRYSLLGLRFVGDCLQATLALQLPGADEESFAAVERMRSSPFSRVETLSRVVGLLDVDALLARDGPGDARRAAETSANVSTISTQTYLGWSVCPELAKARVAARLKHTDAPVALRRALNAVEQNARSTPLTADAAFDQLAAAAFEAGDDLVAVRAESRALSFRSARTLAGHNVPPI